MLEKTKGGRKHCAKRVLILECVRLSRGIDTASKLSSKYMHDYYYYLGLKQ